MTEDKRFLSSFLQKGLKTNQLEVNTDERTQRHFARLKEPRDLFALPKDKDNVCPQQAPRWPIECQVIEERIMHIGSVPTSPEAYNQLSGSELKPRPVGEENGIVVFNYNPISAVNYDQKKNPNYHESSDSDSSTDSEDELPKEPIPKVQKEKPFVELVEEEPPSDESDSSDTIEARAQHEAVKKELSLINARCISPVRFDPKKLARFNLENNSTTTTTTTTITTTTTTSGSNYSEFSERKKNISGGKSKKIDDFLVRYFKIAGKISSSSPPSKNKYSTETLTNNCDKYVINATDKINIKKENSKNQNNIKHEDNIRKENIIKKKNIKKDIDNDKQVNDDNADNIDNDISFKKNESKNCDTLKTSSSNSISLSQFSRSAVGGSKILTNCHPYNTEDYKGLTFESRFESGNLAKAVMITPTYYELYLRPDLYTSRSKQWYYFRVKNTRRNIIYRFSIVNLVKSDSLYNDGMRPLMYSTFDANSLNLGWRRCGDNICYYRNDEENVSEDDEENASYTLTFNVEFPYDDDTVYFAHSYPYTYSDLQDYLMDIQRHPVKSKFCKLRLLCRSLAGNNVYYLTVTAPTADEDAMKRKKSIVVSARVHPSEAPSSWMMKGLMDFITGDTTVAKRLRHKFIFKLIPMLNPDGVIVGNTRNSLTGKDLNRQYRTVIRETYPSIWYTKAMIKRLIDECGVAMYCDMHAHSRKHNIFIYGCENKRNPEKKLTEQVFPLMMHKNVADKFSFEGCKFKIQRSKEGTGRIVVWMLGITNSYTIEASFGGSSLGSRRGTHFNTMDYEHMGRAFCETLLDYCDENPTKVRKQERMFKQIKKIRKRERRERKALKLKKLAEQERLRLKIIERLLKEGSSADEPLNIQLSDYSSDEGDTSSSSENEGKAAQYSDLEGPCCLPTKAPPSSPDILTAERKQKYSRMKKIMKELDRIYFQPILKRKLRLIMNAQQNKLNLQRKKMLTLKKRKKINETSLKFKSDLEIIKAKGKIFYFRQLVKANERERQKNQLKKYQKKIQNKLDKELQMKVERKLKLQWNKYFARLKANEQKKIENNAVENVQNPSQKNANKKENKNQNNFSKERSNQKKTTPIVTQNFIQIITQKPTQIITQNPAQIITQKPTQITTQKRAQIITQKRAQTTQLKKKPKSKQYENKEIKQIYRRSERTFQHEYDPEDEINSTSTSAESVIKVKSLPRIKLQLRNAYNNTLKSATLKPTKKNQKVSAAKKATMVLKSKHPLKIKPEAQTKELTAIPDEKHFPLEIVMAEPTADLKPKTAQQGLNLRNPKLGLKTIKKINLGATGNETAKFSAETLQKNISQQIKKIELEKSKNNNDVSNRNPIKKIKPRIKISKKLLLWLSRRHIYISRQKKHRRLRHHNKPPIRKKIDQNQRIPLDLPTTDPGSDIHFSTDEEQEDNMSIFEFDGDNYVRKQRRLRRILLQSDLQRRYIEEIQSQATNRLMPPELIVTSPMKTKKSLNRTYTGAASTTAPKSAPNKTRTVFEFPAISAPPHRSGTWQHFPNTIKTVTKKKNQHSNSACSPKCDCNSQEELQFRLSLKKKVWTGVQATQNNFVEQNIPLAWNAPSFPMVSKKDKIPAVANPNTTTNKKDSQTNLFVACSEKLLAWQQESNNGFYPGKYDTSSGNCALVDSVLKETMQNEKAMRILRQIAYANAQKAINKLDSKDGKIKKKKNPLLKITETTHSISRAIKGKSRTSHGGQHSLKTIGTNVGLTTAETKKVQTQKLKFKTGSIVATAVQRNPKTTKKSRSNTSLSNKSLPALLTTVPKKESNATPVILMQRRKIVKIKKKEVRITNGTDATTSATATAFAKKYPMDDGKAGTATGGANKKTI